MLKTKVKASTVTNLTDARYFAAWEVEYLGFCLNPHAEEYIQPKVMNAIKEWVDGVKIVGEFDMQTADEIRSAIDLLNLDAVQVGHFTTVETLMELKAEVPVLKELVSNKDTEINAIEEQLEQFTSSVGSFILNFDKSGIQWTDIVAGNPVNYEWLKGICESYPILLSIAIPTEEIEQILEELQAEGLNVVGGEEEKVGYKSFDELDEVFEALEVLV